MWKDWPVGHSLHICSLDNTVFTPFSLSVCQKIKMIFSYKNVPGIGVDPNSAINYSNAEPKYSSWDAIIKVNTSSMEKNSF